MAESLIEDRHKKLYQCLQDNNGPLYVEGLLVSWDIYIYTYINIDADVTSGVFVYRLCLVQR